MNWSPCPSGTTLGRPPCSRQATSEQFDHRARIKLFIDREGDVLAGVFINNVANLDHLAMPG